MKTSLFNYFLYILFNKRPRSGVVLFPIGFKERCLVDDGAFYGAGGLGGVGVGFADGVAGG